MIRFLVRRLAAGALVLWTITTGVFVMFFVAPQQRRPADRRPPGDAQTIAIVQHRLGLDRPVLAPVLVVPRPARCTATSATRSTTRPPVTD